MTKADFLKGVPFSVYGLLADYQFVPTSEPTTLIERKDNKETPVHIAVYETGFSLMTNVFGSKQLVDVAFTHCELK